MPQTTAPNHRSFGRLLFSVLATALAAVPFAAHAQSEVPWWERSIWDDPNRGFYWYAPYPDPQPENLLEPEKPKVKRLENMETMEEFRAEVERLHNVAVMNPTETNILRWHEANDLMMNKAAMFADVARRVLWQNASVNYGARGFPTATFARRDINNRAGEKQKEDLEKMADTHAILFFSKGDCPACDLQAPVLHLVAAETGFRILAISMDGAPIKNFPDAKIDNGISLVVSEGQGIPHLPAMYVINRETGNAIPIGAGNVAGEEILQRIHILTQIPVGQSF